MGDTAPRENPLRWIITAMHSHPADYGSASNMTEATKQHVLAELRLRQSRLGTERELPQDYARVCALAHLLRNRRTVESLLRELSDAPRTPVLRMADTGQA